MSFDDMAKGNRRFYSSGAHLGFHLRVRVVYKSMFYTQTLEHSIRDTKNAIHSLSLISHVFSLSPRVFMC